jgi:hypothetical protein
MLLGETLSRETHASGRNTLLGDARYWERHSWETHAPGRDTLTLLWHYRFSLHTLALTIAFHFTLWHYRFRFPLTLLWHYHFSLHTLALSLFTSHLPCCGIIAFRFPVSAIRTACTCSCRGVNF